MTAQPKHSDDESFTRPDCPNCNRPMRIETRYKMGYSFYCCICKHIEYPPRSERPLSKNVELVKSLYYDSNWNLKMIAEEFKVSLPAVSKFFKRKNWKLRPTLREDCVPYAKRK